MVLSLSALLTSLRVEAADGAIVELTAPGGANFSAKTGGYLHLPISGSIFIEVPQSEPVRIEEGSYAIVVTDRSHSVCDAPGRTPTSVQHFPASHQLDRLPTMRFGGQGKLTKFLTSRFSVDTAGAAVLRGLPPVLLGGGHSAKPVNIWSINAGAVAELLTGPGSTTLVASLTDFCFMQTLRAALLTVSPIGESYSAMHHPQVGAAVKIISQRPAEDWTTAKLGYAVGMSRSAFSAAFKLHVGQAPAEYLTSVRMDQAASLLMTRTSLISEIAHQVGYASESSFIRAFKKNFGTVPSEFRRARRKILRRSITTQGHWDAFLL